MQKHKILRATFYVKFDDEKKRTFGLSTEMPEQDEFDLDIKQLAEALTLAVALNRSLHNNFQMLCDEADDKFVPQILEDFAVHHIKERIENAKRSAN